jgi:hypothetical protein
MARTIRISVPALKPVLRTLAGSRYGGLTVEI